MPSRYYLSIGPLSNDSGFWYVICYRGIRSTGKALSRADLWQEIGAECARIEAMTETMATKRRLKCAAQ